MIAGRRRRIQDLVVRMQQAFLDAPALRLTLPQAAVLDQRGHVRGGAERAGGGRRAEQNIRKSVRSFGSAHDRTRCRLRMGVQVSVRESLYGPVLH
jgi:hypothetical protein